MKKNTLRDDARWNLEGRVPVSGTFTRIKRSAIKY